MHFNFAMDIWSLNPEMYHIYMSLKGNELVVILIAGYLLCNKIL